MAGDTDLDLLVRRADGRRFTDVLCRLGFKEARPAASRQLPGVSSWYGLDDESGRLVHVHAHYQLVLGHDLTKNVHLPLETPLLDTATHSGPFATSSPEFELVLLVVRMVLKRSA